ncbi:MAG: hypothetical protein NC416_18740 [Eubacterium sp.]|nr:hypothetical protein [Eubacterium sp.]
MRKFQKQQLADIFKEIHAVHLQIRDRLPDAEYQTVQNLFAVCQETAIQMGEFIESLEGTGTEAVACLEQYCEKLYQFSTQLGQAAAQRVYRSLESTLTKAENALAHMPVRREVLFLPYKASMWDSLESVYLAAKEDETCDAYVVPIPYYDKTEDGRLGEMHYEGDEYPSNIEITHYNDYEIESRRPDIIYIHNPYDHCNIVTSVPERYFSSHLKKYTDCLVYIPYFLLNEIEPDNQEAIDAMKHFCFLPGIVWADKVIVQSENMRQIYINEFIKAAKESGMPAEYTDRKKLEDKILGLGSPKLDRVHSIRREELEVPEAWRKVIEKPDGTWKKIIFYNTSIGALLHCDDKMIEKMKSVFRIFKEQQDEVALLWRPHPLIESTIKSMRPKLWAAYETIVRTYREEGWGIYDDSADMDRAVLLSDAYYGDTSSVVQVYQETGKPVMIQNVEVL